jgi:glycosyltransferase involved in cell wall biosynthesis
VERVFLPGHVRLHGRVANRPEMYMRYGAAFERFVADLDLDILHRTSWNDPEQPLTRVGLIPTVATHFDLIPLVYEDQYFRGDAFWTGVYRRILDVERASDRLIAISRFVREEAVQWLGVDRDRIDVAYPFADSRFRILPEAEVQRLLARLRRTVGLPERFILNVGDLHFSKNLSGLLRGYARLPQNVRHSYPLVLVFALPPEARVRLNRLLADAGLGPDDVVTTGFVDDDELAALYNASAFYVHPSRYEGFGLPVLEALQCGKAVLAANAAALPEVAGDAGLLIDPDNPEELAEGLQRLVEDESAREALGARATAQAARFSPRHLGDATLEAYEAARGHFSRRRRRPRLAVWTPLPPLRTGVADYSVELLGALDEWADVTVFIAGGYTPDPDLLRRFEVREASAFSAAMARQGYDVVLYQLGASTFHCFAETAIERWPGILTLHDLTWGALVAHQAERLQRLPEFRTRLLEEEGPGALDEFDALGPPGETRFQEGKEAFFNRHYLLGRLVAASLGQVVHMPRAGDELAARYPAARPTFFPMGVLDPWRQLVTRDPRALRERCGLGEREFVLAAFGLADPVKRLGLGVRAIARLRAEGIAARFIVVGSFTSASYRAEISTLARGLAVERHVTLLDHVAPGRFTEMLTTVDVVLNLRLPFRWQMSATLMRAIAAGKPAIVTELEAWDFLPARFCVPVRADAHELERLVDELRALAREPDMRAAAGTEARAWYLENATLGRMSRNYRDMCHQVAGTSPASPA